MEQLNQILILEIFALKFIRENNLKIIMKIKVKKYIFASMEKFKKTLDGCLKKIFIGKLKKLKNFT